MVIYVKNVFFKMKIKDENLKNFLVFIFWGGITVLTDYLKDGRIALQYAKLPLSRFFGMNLEDFAEFTWTTLLSHVELKKNIEFMSTRY